MSKVWDRGGVRFAFDAGDLVVYIDADKLADAAQFDVPEVELIRISGESIKRQFGRFWSDVKDEVGRVKARIKESRNKKRVKKMGG